jgi:MFS family permease
MTRAIRWYDYITFNIYYMGLTIVSSTNGLVFPLLVQQFVGETEQGTFYGRIRLWSLMTALLVQALMGLLSDHSTLRLGRRRPFVFTGTVFNVLFIAAVGFSAGLEGLNGFWFLFITTIMMAVASNTAHAGEQGIIPDLVPTNLRGRFSGVKTLFELPIPLILVSFTIGRLVGAGNLWAALFVTIGVLVITMLLTMLVPEKQLEEAPPLNWRPFVRLLLMTGVFTAIILGMGEIVKITGELISWITAPMTLTVIMGLIGLGTMAVTVALGVWLSVRISLGEGAKENPSYTWWVINRLAFLAGVTNISTFAIFYLQARLGFVRETAAGPAAFLMMLVGVCILLSALPSGWLSDRFGLKPMVGVSGLLAALGTFIALLTTNIYVIYVGGCIIGIAAGLFYTSNWALGTILVPKKDAARYLGISNLAGAGAGAVGAYIGGPIADYFTANVPHISGLGYILLFSIYGTLFLFSILALTQIKNPGSMHQE